MALIRIKHLRIDNDLTHENISKILNCSRSTYSSWENNDARIPLYILDKLSVYYNVRLSYLLGLEDNTKTNCKIKPMNYNSLLQNLNNLKKEKKQSYQEIADFIKCNKSTCFRYLNGAIEIPFDILILLAKLYEFNLDKICDKE